MNNILKLLACLAYLLLAGCNSNLSSSSVSPVIFDPTAFEQRLICDLFEIDTAAFSKVQAMDYAGMAYWTLSGSSQRIYYLEGKGLWDKIWAYVLVDGALSTLKRVEFDHNAETPGMGAEIKDNPNFKRGFTNIAFVDEALQILEMSFDTATTKIEIGATTIDGISGATVTMNGLTKMMNKGFYQIRQSVTK